MCENKKPGIFIISAGDWFTLFFAAVMVAGIGIVVAAFLKLLWFVAFVWEVK